MRTGPLEITDLLWAYDDAGTRLPVRRSEVAAVLRERGQARPARIVERLPATDDVLDPDAMDELGVRVHCELQRLGEELQLGRRIAALVQPLVRALGLDDGEPYRIVDVGCGLGHVVRSMACRRVLPPYVELVGVDLNPALTREAERLARVEGLDCRFVTGDAFAPGVAVEAGPRTIVLSTGLLHHVAPDELPAFFAAQAALDVRAFVHWDIAPCAWSTIGAWLFHMGRMREPVSRHDGVLSARRSHPADVLLAAAAEGAPGYDLEVREGSRWHPRAIDVVRPLVGTRR